MLRYAGQGRAGQGRAGQGRAGRGRAGCNEDMTCLLLCCPKLGLGFSLRLLSLLAIGWVSSEQIHI